MRGKSREGREEERRGRGDEREEGRKSGERKGMEGRGWSPIFHTPSRLCCVRICYS